MAVNYNIAIDQGATYDKQFLFVNDGSNTVIDMSTYTANAALKQTYSSNAAYVFSTNMAANGVVTISMSANTSSQVPAGRYVWDLVVSSNTGVVSRLLEGIATIVSRVSR